jgi:hypothetical protein
MAEIENKYDRIRNILSVTESDISNTAIDYPEYFPTAERWCQNTVPNYAELTDTKKVQYESLVLYKTAQRLIPYCQSSVWNIQKEKTTHAEVDYFSSNYEIIIANIKDNINELLSELLMDNSYVSVPFIGIDRTGRR